MNGLVLTIRIVAGPGRRSRSARLLPLRSRVVLATAHAATLGGNLASIADDLAARHPEIPVVVLAHRPGVGGRGRIAAAWPRGRRRLLPRDLARVRRRRLLLPDLRHPPAAGHDDHPDVARLRRVQEGRLQRARQVVRGGRGARPAGSGSTRTTTSAWSPRRRPRRTTPRRSASRSSGFGPTSGIPRTDVLFGEERLARTRAAVRERYGLTDGRRVILYAPTFRGDSVTDARATDDLDLRRHARALGDDHVLLVRLHPFVRSRDADRPGPRGLRHRRLGPPRHQRADARQRRPRDRLLERDLRVLAARPADGLLRARLRGVRAGARLLLRLPDRRARARSSRRPRRWPRTCGPGSSISSACERFREASFDVADGGSSTRVTDALIVPSLTRAGDRR